MRLLIILLVLIFAVLGAVFGALNGERVAYDFYFLTASLPKGAMLIAALLAGWLIGGIVVYFGLVLRLRRRVRELHSDLHRVRSAPLPSAYCKQRMRAQIDELAMRGEPSMALLIEHDREIVWPMTLVQSTVRGGEHLTRSLVYLDHSLVDGVVNGTAAGFGGLSGRLRRLQNGFARSYAVSMFGGAALLIAATLLMRAV